MVFLHADARSLSCGELAVEPLQGERQQRQGIGAVGISHQDLGELGIDHERLHCFAVPAGRAFDHRLELRGRHRRQAEQHRREGLQSLLRLELGQGIGADRQQQEHPQATAAGRSCRDLAAQLLEVPQERLRFRLPVGGKELLALIHRQHHGPLDRGLPRILRTAPAFNAPQQVREALLFQLGAQLGEAHRLSGDSKGGLQAGEQALRAGEGRALGADRGEHHIVLAVAAQARQQPGPQERRLARPGSTEQHKQMLNAPLSHQAQLVEGAHERGLAPEEHGRVPRLQGPQAGIGRAAWVALRRPQEGGGIQPRLAQPPPQSFQPGAGEGHLGGRHHGDPLHLEWHWVVRMGEIAHLPLGGHLLRQVRQRNRLHDHAEDAFAKLLGLEEFGETVLRVLPGG